MLPLPLKIYIYICHYVFLGIYVAATLCVAALATFLTVGILFIHHRQGEPRIGSFYYSMSRGIAKLCCWHDKSGRSLTKVEPAENGVPDKPGSGRAKSRSESYRDEPLTWVNIAEIWDWFCFVIFVIMTLLLNIVFILVLAVGGTNSSKA